MKRKILSIDGGGIKGVFAAQFLADIEEEYNIRLCDYFDIITGTSTGAIIACGLSLGISASEILNLYLKKGNDIFKGSRLLGFAKSLLYSKYKNTNLEKELDEVFKGKLIGDSKTRLLIPTFNIETGCVEIFKTSHHPEYKRDYKAKMLDVLLSTTAAPTYFPAYTFVNRGRYIDGGIGANNPSYIAVVEAITSCGWKSEDISLLSVGCTDDYKKFPSNSRVNLLHAREIKDFFMRAEQQYSENISKLILEKDNYIRINPTITSGECALDSVSKKSLSILIAYAKDASKKHGGDVSNLFLNEKKEAFVPYNTK